MITNSNIQDNFSIGVFDSGVGGLTIAKAILDVLPSERIIYFGDTAHLPYGDKSADAIRYYSLKICKMLLEQNCKMIVVACNTASSAAYSVLLDFFKSSALFVNVVDPLAKEAARLAEKKVGIIATKATVRSNVYKTKLETLRPELEIAQVATPLFAPMIEEGFFNNNISQSIIDNYLSDPALEGIDTLLLACTHYPLIKEDIERYYNHKVKVLDSTMVTASEVREKLDQHNLLNQDSIDTHKFYVSDLTESFSETTKLFFKEKINLEENAIW